MKVSELVKLLEACDPDDDVRLALQPHYPHEHAVAGVVSASDLAKMNDRDPCEAAPNAPRVVYLAEGAWLGYGNRDVWQLVP